MNLVTQIQQFPEFFPDEKQHSRFSKADYFAIMCHEIGTPLAAVISLSHILATMECGPQQKKECAEMLRDSSKMLTDLMKNMLDSSRLAAGMIEIENIKFDLAKTVREATHIISTQAAEKGLHLHVHVAGGLPSHCIGDPLRIRQILLNLLSNAVKFTEKGHVSLYVNAKKDLVGNDLLCMTVSDTGIGIREESMEMIFGKYTQEDPSVSREYGGTGLGLSISQELAQLMRGNISVKSWLGLGSHFIVTLPLQKDDAPESPKE